MRSFALFASLVLLCSAVALPAQAATKHHKHKSHAAKKLHGQRAIQSERATEIQTALIREHYLDGQPTGQWDSATEAAMRKMQADNGWQTKITPDSRALIKLGLGPDHSSDIGSAKAPAALGSATGSSN